MSAVTFFDRTRELRHLAEAWAAARSGSPRLVVVSGHRRVGKSYLLLHFLDQLSGGTPLYFFATQQAERIELERFTAAVSPVFSDEPALAAGVRPTDWEQAFSVVIASARRGPVALVIDEAPYLAESTPGFASVVQAVWDRLAREPRPTHLLLVLTGSATSVVESMVGPAGPLRGRVDDHLRVRPFELPVVGEILEVPPEQAVEIYAACGGWPLHLQAWDVARSLDHNLRELAGRSGGPLLEDAEIILRDLPDAPGYGKVLAAIGRGRRRFSEILDDAGQRIEHPLDFLVETGLIRKDTPIGSPRRSRPLYELADPYLRFWFDLIYTDRGRIHGGQGDAVLSQRRERWRTHLGWVFEEAAREHARRLTITDANFHGLVTGRWWTTSGPAAEVDVLGLDGPRSALLGEAKWSRSVDRRTVTRLRAALDYVPDPVDDPLLCLWTRDPDASLARESGVRVFGPRDVVSG